MPKTKNLLKLLLVSSLTLIACSSNKPAPVVSSAVVQPKIKPRVEPSIAYLPETGERTVGDVLQAYGKHVSHKLGHYFKKANVAYPPREVTLVALKNEKKMELWARDSGSFRFIRDYHIMAASGDPGPKLRQGDRQVPEGIYHITKLNPNSHYHLSMKLNYPNEFDMIHAEQDGRTDLGSDIYIHGKHASIGCLAMGDSTIRELFVLAALVGIQNMKVVIAPHDPRAHPLMTYDEESPMWTSELYSMISHEFDVLSHGVNKVAKVQGNSFTR